MPYRLYGPRPAEPKAGDRWMQPIDEILQYWYSGDGGEPGDWEAMVLADIRMDSHYDVLKDRIAREGFKAPLTCDVSTGRGYGFPFMCDGHHRLAIAIDLGYTEVPMRAFDFHAIAYDSGEWDEKSVCTTYF